MDDEPAFLPKHMRVAFENNPPFIVVDSESPDATSVNSSGKRGKHGAGEGKKPKSEGQKDAPTQERCTNKADMNRDNAKIAFIDSGNAYGTRKDAKDPPPDSNNANSETKDANFASKKTKTLDESKHDVQKPDQEPLWTLPSSNYPTETPPNRTKRHRQPRFDARTTRMTKVQAKQKRKRPMRKSPPSKDTTETRKPGSVASVTIRGGVW